MPALVTKYRPSTLDEFIGNTAIISRLKVMAGRGGYGGRAFWIAGASGTGKTTLAYIIAQALADDMNILELDAATLSASAIQTAEQDSRLFGMGAKNGRAIIVNEAHGLNRQAMKQLLVTLEAERIPQHVTWIFTTTNEGQDLLFENTDDASPLISRTIRLQLTNQGLAKPFTTRLMEIASAEGLLGQTTEKTIYLLVQKCKNNFRACLNAIDAGELLGA
jgi:replication-associated recombination protein RarA